MTIDGFLPFSDTSLHLNRPKMFLRELPKNLEFLWNFQTICFFFSLVLEPKDVKICARTAAGLSRPPPRLNFWHFGIQKQMKKWANHPKFMENSFMCPKRVFHKFRTICTIFFMFFDQKMLKIGWISTKKWKNVIKLISGEIEAKQCGCVQKFPKWHFWVRTLFRGKKCRRITCDPQKND